MTDTPNFELFRRRSVVPGGYNPQVSLLRTGAITMNQKAFEAMGNPKACLLLFDPKQQVLGLRRVDPGDINAFPVHPNRSGQSYTINALSFFQFFQIPRDNARRYTARMMNDILTVDLKGEYANATNIRTASSKPPRSRKRKESQTTEQAQTEVEAAAESEQTEAAV